VIGIASFGVNALSASANDSPSGTIGTCPAMKSIGSTQRRLREGDLVLLDIPSGFRGYHTDKSICYFFGSLDAHPSGKLIRSAREQCVFLEHEAASMLRPGAVPSEIYKKLCACVDPCFRDGFMNGCKFLGHSIGLTMDESPVIANGFDAPIQVGMTFAIEPKIALPGIGLVGCENTYEVVEHGAARSLTGLCDTILEVHG
jgi:Xaa-Pro aminopeptidase